MQRRDALKLLALLALAPRPGLAQIKDTGLLPIHINIPGPHLLPFLPIELIPLLGIDHALGAQLAIRYLPSGVQALEDVLAGNAHFAGVAFSVLPTFLEKRKRATAIAVLGSGTPPYAVLIRNDLSGQIRTLADLKGRSIGVAMGSATSKTYLQMLMELWLQANGVQSNQVRWVPTGQNYDGMFGALAGGTVDAVFCEEPLAGSIARQKIGTTLASLADPKNPVRMVGQRHLRAVVASSPEVLNANPRRAELMAAMVRRVLAWVRRASAPDMVQRLGIANPEMALDMADALARMPGLYSPDGRFSGAEIESTRQFLKVAGAAMPSGQDIRALIMDQWIRRAR